MVVAPVFTAGEDPIPNINAEKFAGKLSETHPSVSYLDNLDHLDQHLLEHTSEGDTVISLGAGSISGKTRQLVADWGLDNTSEDTN